MVLQRLIQEQHLAITDSLLDNNNTVLKVRVYSLFSSDFQVNIYKRHHLERTRVRKTLRSHGRWEKEGVASPSYLSKLYPSC